MRSFLPDRGASRTDQGELARLVAAVAVSHASKRLSTDEAAQLSSIVEFIRGHTHPAIFGWLNEAAGLDDWPAVRSEFDRYVCAATRNHHMIAVRVSINRFASRSTFSDARAMAQSIHGDTEEIVAAPALSEREIEGVRDAVAVLRRAWPEAAEELETFVQEVVFFDSPRAIGFVDFRSHGAIHIRRDRIGDPVELAEELLHEASHVRLNAAIAVDPLFLDSDEERFATPLRRELRSMFSVVHQLFVLSRLHILYERIGGHDIRRAQIGRSLHEAYEVVVSSAQLTPTGESVLASIDEHCSAA